MLKNVFLASAGAVLLVACGGETQSEAPAPQVEESAAPQTEAASVEESASVAVAPAERLAEVLANQTDETKARYGARHPAETLAFFGVEPGMTVVDTLPGDPWYSGILSEYLGADGKVIGANYAIALGEAARGSSYTEEELAERRNWATQWVADREADRKEGEAPFAGFRYGSVPAEMEGAADVVLMVRAAHHLNRLEDEGGFFTEALADVKKLLVPGGTLGIVQHRAPEGNDDVWAEGDNGYVKQSQVIAFVEAAGFELVAASEINANPKDQPTTEDAVWRLPPVMSTSREDEELRAQMIEIGESDRMTLKFKPVE